MELDARSFRGLDFAAAEMQAKDEAERAAEGQVLDALEENLPAEAEQSEWNWEALAKMVNIHWNLGLRDRDLKKIARDEIGEFLLARAREAIQKVDLSEGAHFLAADFGVKTAGGWIRHKFGFELPLAEIAGLECEQVKELVRHRAEAAYHRKGNRISR